MPPTTKKKKKAMPVKNKGRVSAFRSHETEFAEAVMAPKLYQLLYNADFSLNYRELASCYEAAFGIALSVSQIKRYLDLLGWKYERVPTWTGLPEAIETSQVGPAEPAEPVMRPADVSEDAVADDGESSFAGGVSMPGQAVPLDASERRLLQQ